MWEQKQQIQPISGQQISAHILKPSYLTDDSYCA